MSSVEITCGMEPQRREFYVQTLETLQRAGAPFLVGGAYAFAVYTGIERHTKDFDLFVRRRDYDQVMQAFAEHGWSVELTFPHWLGKAFEGMHFIDVIFGSGNGVAMVDDLWFEHAEEGEVLGIPVRLCPPEEMIWSKAFVMERERYDGADVMHTLRARGDQLDWRRLIDRFGPHWQVLFSNLVLFDFIYPSDRSCVPEWVRDEMLERLQQERQAPPIQVQICRGTLLSRAQYLIDIARWGYQDARCVPGGPMLPEDVKHWTAAMMNPDR
ncbi:MAG: nucleotidyltransferase family protein [Roseiflexaceae bacterium]